MRSGVEGEMRRAWEAGPPPPALRLVRPPDFGEGPPPPPPAPAPAAPVVVNVYAPGVTVVIGGDGQAIRHPEGIFALTGSGGCGTGGQIVGAPGDGAPSKDDPMQQPSLRQGMARVRAADAIADFLADAALSGNVPDTIAGARNAISRASKPWGGYIDGFTTEAARGYLMRCRTRGLMPKTLKNYRDHLDRLGKWCAAKGILPANPMDGVVEIDVPQRQARLIPTDDEVARLVRFLRPRKQQKDLWLKVLCAATVPARYAVWGKLRPEHCKVRQPHAGFAVPGMWMKRKRDLTVWLPMPPWLAALVRAKIEAGDLAPDGRLFRAVCKPQSFKLLAIKAGVRQSEGVKGEPGYVTFSWHSLKHYASNRRLRLGWTREQRAAANDHAEVRMTEEVYSDPELMRRFDPTLAAVMELTDRMPPPADFSDFVSPAGSGVCGMLAAPNAPDSPGAGSSGLDSSPKVGYLPNGDPVDMPPMPDTLAHHDGSAACPPGHPTGHRQSEHSGNGQAADRRDSAQSLNENGPDPTEGTGLVSPEIRARGFEEVAPFSTALPNGGDGRRDALAQYLEDRARADLSLAALIRAGGRP